MSVETDLDLPEIAGAETFGRFTFTQLDWWYAHFDAFSEAVAVIESDELHVDRRTVGPVIEERPPQRLTMTVEEAAVVLGTARDRLRRREPWRDPLHPHWQAHPHPQGGPGAVAGRC